MGQTEGRSGDSVISAEAVRRMVAISELADLDDYEPLEGGWDNTCVLLSLEDGSRVVLKAWNGNTVGEVKKVIARHCHLDSYGIPTPVPIELPDGRLLVEMEGTAWTLLPYFDGGMLESDEASLRSLGEFQARMHEIPVADCFPRTFTMGFEFFERVFEMVEGEISEFLVMLRTEASKLKSRISTDLPFGVLHGDLFPDNVIGSNGGVSAILDLEEAWIGPKAFDLVMSFVGFGWDDGRPVEGRWAALVEGYQSVRELSEEEVSALPHLYRYATLSIACWRYWKHNISVPDETLCDRYLEMVDRLGVELDLEGYFE